MSLGSGHQQSSLELMLDTVCNVFGGIVLMAILVVLQTRGTVARMPGPGSHGLDTFFEARELRFRERQLNRELRELQQQRDKLLDTERPGRDSNLSVLVERYSEFKKAIAESSEKAEHQKAELVRKEQTLADLRNKGKAAEKRLKAKQRTIDGLKRQILNLAESPTKKMRLPHRRGAAAGKARYYVIKNKKLYRAGTTGITRWRGPPYMLEDCRVTPQGTEALQIAMSLPPGRGLEVSDRRESLLAIRRSLADYPPTTYYCYFWVCSSNTSYATFQTLRKLVTRMGYQYGVGVLDRDDGPLIFVPTSYHETE